MNIETLIKEIEFNHGHKIDSESSIYVKVPLLTDNPFKINPVDHLTLINGYVPINSLLTYSTLFPLKLIPSDHGEYVRVEPSGLLLPKNVVEHNNLKYSTKLPRIITLTYE